LHYTRNMVGTLSPSISDDERRRSTIKIHRPCSSHRPKRDYILFAQCSKRCLHRKHLKAARMSNLLIIPTPRCNSLHEDQVLDVRSGMQRCFSCSISTRLITQHHFSSDRFYAQSRQGLKRKRSDTSSDSEDRAAYEFFNGPQRRAVLRVFNRPGTAFRPFDTSRYSKCGTIKLVPRCLSANQKVDRFWK
jgi:hypothetical protein